MAAAEQLNARARRRRTILLLCIVLLLCGIGAEGYLLIRRAENAIPVMQRDPAAELTDAVSSGDFEAAKLIRLTDFPDGIVPESVTETVTAQAQAVRDAYFQRLTDAETAGTQIASIAALGIPALTEAVQPLSEEIRMHEAWLLIIRKADASFAAGNYADAYTQYGRIPNSEQALQQQIAPNYTQSAALLTVQAQAHADAAEQAHDYDEAIRQLNQTLRILGGKDDGLEARLADVRQHQIIYQYLLACRQARMHFDAGEYAAAAEALSGTPQIIWEAAARSDVQIHDQKDVYPYFSMLCDTLQSYQDTYFRILMQKLHTLLADGDLTQAQTLAAEAETLYPEAAQLAAVQALMQQAAPKELISFGEPALSDFTAAESALTGSDGKTYESESGNLFYSYDGALSGRKSCSAEFTLDGTYRRLTLTALPLNTFAKDTVVLLEISSGGRILETYAVSRKNGVLHIDLDITGAKTLRLRVKPSGMDEDLRNAGVIIADAKVIA